MKKQLFSATAGVLLLAGTGTASAVTLIGVSPNEVEGYLSLANFGQGAWTTPTSNPSQNFTLLFDYLNNLQDPYKPSKDTVPLQASWSGTVTSNLPDLTFGNPGNPPPDVAGKSITIGYNGFSLLGKSFTGVGTLTLTVQSDDYNTLSFSGLDVCTSGSATSLTNVCFTRALYLLDLGSSKPGVIDGVFFKEGSNPSGSETTLSFLPSQTTSITIDLFSPSLGLKFDPSPVPEPASLALMGIGIAGLGVARRKKEAA